MELLSRFMELNQYLNDSALAIFSTFLIKFNLLNFRKIIIMFQIYGYF